ncbi:hypothetical protein N7494_001886 [Penicillium frequentans]|uniref:Mediator of RNA polymerase II transcription subunit 22 n=1 Tax=Penicillium frequentans TaxID=3151616 RepID=A0AAD6GJE1_9EURO|nr:hypothetical protein N7494_001886 [Penicillium glabrum]
MVKRSASRSSEEASPSGLDSDDLNIDIGNLNIKSAKPKHPKVKLPKVLNPIPKRHKVKNPDIDVYLVKSTHNMDSQLTAKALHSRINTNVSQLLQRFENIMATATIQNPSHTATAVETYQLDVESTALIRSAEDILSLSRTMKEMWLFGKLDTIGEDERDVERREKLDKDVLAVEEALKEGALAKIAPEK